VGEAPRRRQVVRFGVFELDSSTGELRKDGKSEPRLREQALRVLLMLLERPREMVPREELRQRLWSSDTFVDFDHGLNTAINQLRNALGDSAANPRYVQTIPRRGYRFIAPVSTVNSGIGLADQERAPSHAHEPDQALPRSNDPDETVSQPARGAVLSHPRELPVVPRGAVRFLFSLIQTMYLSFYVVSLARLPKVEVILAESRNFPRLILIVLLVTAAIGIPIRLYLLAASAFNYRGLTGKFQKLFPFLFVLDELWALAPFLIVSVIGAGSAIAATAALLYLPFSQRSLLLMGSSAQQE
jgi:cholera toxin transcriptional activator